MLASAVRERAASAAVTASQFIAQNALAVGQGTFSFVLKLALMLYVAYFLLRDGPALVDVIAQPLQDAAAPVSEWVA